MKSKKIHIGGMTCTSCETLIKEELKEIDGIDKVDISRKENEGEIFYIKDINFEDVKARIVNLGYQVDDTSFSGKAKKATAKQWFFSLLIVLGLYLGYKLLQALGLLGWVDVGTTQVSFGIAFLVGIIASMSSCLAVVGGVVVSFGARYKSEGNFFQANVKPHLFFHAGRLFTFLILGGILGIIGSWINLSGSAMGWFTIVIAIVMVLLGLNILGVAPSLSRLGIRMPNQKRAFLQ